MYALESLFNLYTVVVIICLVAIYWIFNRQNGDIVKIEMDRHFVINCNKAPLCCTDILLQDLKKCRVDLMARCINSALITSHSIRNNSKISFFCVNNKNPATIMTFDGDQCKHIRPDERTLAAMIKHALYYGPMTNQEKNKLFEQHTKTKVLKGVDVATHLNDLCSFVDILISTDSNQRQYHTVFVINLTETGYEINLWIDQQRKEIVARSKFVILLGDSKDIEQQCLHQIKQNCYNNVEFIDIKIGNISLLSSHAIILFHHYIDVFLGCQ